MLIGGWVPDIRFPDAHPAHVGSIDVDFATRADRARHDQIVALLLRHGFRRGSEPYQFIKQVTVSGRSFPARLDLLTSPQHHARTFTDDPQAPFPAAGAELAFASNSVESVGDAEVRVASIVPLIVMKAHAILERAKPKDAYDLNFCLENYPGGIPALAAEFTAFMYDPAVRDVLSRLAGKFRDEEDTGPRDVVEVEEVMGDARAMRKFAVFIQVTDFLHAVGIVM